MKKIHSLLILSALFFYSFLAAETLNRDVTLADGTVIPAGSTVITGEDNTVEYRDPDGIILAQVTTIQTAEGGLRIIIIKRLPDGTYVRVVVEKAPGDVDITIVEEGPVDPPTPIDPDPDPRPDPDPDPGPPPGPDDEDDEGIIDEEKGVEGDPSTPFGPDGGGIDSVGETVI